MLVGLTYSALSPLPTTILRDGATRPFAEPYCLLGVLRSLLLVVSASSGRTATMTCILAPSYEHYFSGVLPAVACMPPCVACVVLRAVQAGYGHCCRTALLAHAGTYCLRRRVLRTVDAAAFICRLIEHHNAFYANRNLLGAAARFHHAARCGLLRAPVERDWGDMDAACVADMFTLPW